MARVLIVDSAGRADAATAALAEAGFATRTVVGEPLLPGNVFEALEGVAVVAWLRGAGDEPHALANGEQLETVLLKIVDTGVRGFVFERGAPGEVNPHVEHARATWHIPIAEIDQADAAGGEQWAAALVTAVNRSLGI
ncbi:MAG: hypothetical protein ACRDKI_10250 [Solirubrobacterales bacterium]